MRQAMTVWCLVLVFAAGACNRTGSGTTTPEQDFADDVDPGAGLEPEPEPPPPVPVQVRLRVVHAAATASKAPLTVSYAAGDDAGVVGEAVAFGSTSSYAGATLPPESTEVALDVMAEGFEGPDDPLPIAGGAAHTAVVFSDPETRDRLGISLAQDSATGPEDGMRVRFFHAMLGTDDVDVCLPGATARDPGVPRFSGVAYGSLAQEGYVDVPADAARIQIRAANEDEPCSGRVLGGVDLRPPAGVDPSGQNLTFLAVGRATGRPAVPRALVVCTDAPAEVPACFRLQVRAR